MREIRVAATGRLTVSDTDVPEPGPGEVLVRNRYFTVFAALRTLLAGGVPGAPLPALRPGDTLVGPAIGEIVTGPDAGALVRHLRGWREYAVLPAAEAEPLTTALPDPVAHFAQGATAYGALTRAAPVRAGDTVFVSGGAGSVGTMAGQIARLLGAARVIGSTGSAWKAERMLALGYHAAVTRPFGERLAEAAPDGVDVVFDNVGGDDLRAAIAVANRSARFALVGALSGQLAEHGTGTTGPVEIDSYQLILKQITMIGYSAGGDAAVRAEWDERFAAWLAAGRIEFPHVLVDGIEQAPQALRDVWAGRHFGTVVVALS
ncbi:NADPH-dependent curcumin reductase CurA [Actinoplanes octamycinicus]|uniref:NADPH-dependent curcumin reductase CurA n=1 Tax=Actinoplanes octamycinicus TaxID=135948 RepID=A0A7W7H2X3_9ACTN|nr:NADP-dependent oxidoreductase [Actinoplanes octamycinicus]MBB4742975.1 NADPH-dependent curcumin reductase CurA [Actinoplanes octamycinicus]GIE58172.1 NADP-dependent oxidoreductase [Actinoplanes octamycinicus]